MGRWNFTSSKIRRIACRHDAPFLFLVHYLMKMFPTRDVLLHVFKLGCVEEVPLVDSGVPAGTHSFSYAVPGVLPPAKFLQPSGLVP